MQLTANQADALKRAARDRGVSMAEVLRELVDEHLLPAPIDSRRQRAIDAIGRYRSGRHDVSEEHDRELGVALAR